MPLELQTSLGYSPLEAGIALLPLTLVMLLLSARGGRLAQRIGPRLPMTVGPIVVGCGMLLMTRIGPGASYVTEVLPAVLVLALGLATTVAPLTTTVLAAADDSDAGVASAINNTVARVAGLFAVAVIPVAAGLGATDYLDPTALDEAFDRGVVIAGTPRGRERRPRVRDDPEPEQDAAGRADVQLRAGRAAGAGDVRGDRGAA